MTYLDYNATTPIAPEVREAMMPFLTEHFGNPSSGHEVGRRASEAVETARAQVAEFIGAEAREIVFTSGGTEASNLAIRGAFAASERGTVVTSLIEHPATTEPCRHLVERHSARLHEVGVDEYGVVDTEELERVVDGRTAVVSVMHANNEVGTLQPIREIAEIADASGAVMHTDAAQTVGKVPVDVDDLGVDLLTIAGHKVYAPKGVGALYVRGGTPIEPILYGAGHEGGLRPGTENVPYIVALGAACELAGELLVESATRMRKLRDRLWDGIRESMPDAVLFGHPDRRLPNTLNVGFSRSGRAVLDALDDVAASTGSACHDDVVEPSRVLTAMGIERDRALGAVRFSLGRETTADDIDSVLRALESADF